MDDVQIVSSVDANLGAVFVGVAFSAMYVCVVPPPQERVES